VSLSSQQQEQLSYISLPMQSPSTSKADSTLLTVISTYLTYSLTIVVESISNTAKKRDDCNIRLLADILDSTRTDADGNSHNSQFQTLLFWLPSFSSLPSNHIDALLSRAYNSLTKFCTASLSPPVQRPSSRKLLSVDASLHRDAYRIRMYALQCLVHVTDGVVAPGTIWEQVIRFGTSYVKSIASQSNSENESVATQTILDACSRIVDRVEALPDRERLLKEKAFVSFLEWWMAFARRVRQRVFMSDLDALTVI
jgi:separase